MWYLIILVFLALFSLKLYLKYITGWCKSHTCLVDKTVVITGGTSGIGFATAVDLAKRGAKIILGSINQQEGDEAKSQIINETGNNNITVLVVDLSSFKSVRNFAKHILQSERRLDILINNAGVSGIGNKTTPDGCLLTMQINYFSPFLLTNLLIGLLQKTPSSRIVNVSSLMAQFVKNFDVEKITEFPGNHSTLYNWSKLCMMLFTIELARKLENKGVTSYSVHPGMVRTNIFTNVHGLGKFLIYLGYVFFKTREEGAQTSIHCAVSKGIEHYNGEHFVDCKKVERYKTALDSQLGKDLWKKTRKIVKLTQQESSL